MFDVASLDLSLVQWVSLCVCGVMVGVAKTGVPGVGILAVPMLALMFPVKASTGLLLPMLAFADLFAVGYYHKHAQWDHIFRLLPAAVVGIITGSIVIRHIENVHLQPIIGIIVLSMLALSYWRNKRNGQEVSIPKHWSFALSIGFLAGLTTQLANAAGPLMIIYLLAMKLEKNKFIGTAAWFFLILNWLKIPLFVWDGRVTVESLKADVIAVPFVIVGAVLGIFILKRIPQKWFNIVVEILVLAAAVKLILG